MEGEEQKGPIEYRERGSISKGGSLFMQVLDSGMFSYLIGTCSPLVLSLF